MLCSHILYRHFFGPVNVVLRPLHSSHCRGVPPGTAGERAEGFLGWGTQSTTAVIEDCDPHTSFFKTPVSARAEQLGRTGLADQRGAAKPCRQPNRALLLFGSAHQK